MKKIIAYIPAEPGDTYTDMINGERVKMAEVWVPGVRPAQPNEVRNEEGVKGIQTACGYRPTDGGVKEVVHIPADVVVGSNEFIGAFRGTGRYSEIEQQKEMKASAWDNLTRIIESIDDNPNYDNEDNPSRKRNERIADMVDNSLFIYTENNHKKRSRKRKYG